MRCVLLNQLKHNPNPKKVWTRHKQKTEFDDRSNKRLGELLYAPESPVWNAPQLAGSLVTANRNMVVSFTSMLGRGSPLFETHDYIKDITARAKEEFVRLLLLNTICSQIIAF